MAKYCTSCGAPLEGAAKFCPGCGTQTVAAGTQTVAVGAKAPESPQPVQQTPLYSPPSVPAPTAPKKKSKAPLIVGGAIALVVLIAVIAFSGREDSGVGPAPYTPDYSGGGMPTAGGNPGQAAQPTEPPTQQPSRNIDPGLVGKWDRNSHINNHSVNKSTNKFVYTGDSYVYEAQVWEFYNDGTFFYFFHNDKLYGEGSARWGLLMYKGNYQVDGDMIYCTNVMCSFQDYQEPSKSYGFRASDNFKLGYNIEYDAYCWLCEETHHELKLNDSNMANTKTYDPNSGFWNWNYIR